MLFKPKDFFGDAWRCPGKTWCHQSFEINLFGDAWRWPAMRPSHQLLVMLLVLALLLFPARVVAQEPVVGSEGLTWPAAETDLTLTISGPGDLYLQEIFNAGQAPFFSPAGRPDGLYTYELAGPEDVQSGYFSIAGGVLVLPETEGGGLKDQVVADDLIVAGSACVGLDCVEDESFDFDTFRLKENNIRLEFQDTSDTGSFPTRDWRITINDTANGGASRFSIDSVDNGETPFTLEYGAPDHSLYVDDAGRLGVGTSVPAAELHIVSGLTPTLRLDQDTSAGQSARTWDLAADDEAFSIIDVTSDTTPIRVETGTPSGSLSINATGGSAGKVGINTISTPHGGVGAATLAIHGATGSAGFGPHLQATTTANNYPLLQMLNWGHNNVAVSFDAYFDGTWRSGYPNSNFQIYKIGDVFRIRYDNGVAYGNALTWNEGLSLNTSGRVGIGTASPGGPFEVNDGSEPLMLLYASGNLSITGVLSEMSDRTAKTNIQAVDENDILTSLANLPISTWSLKTDDSSVRHLGPMAQDFHAAFGLGHDDRHISSLDTSGVALAAIQALYQKQQADEARIAALEAQIAALESQIETLTGETGAPPPQSQSHRRYLPFVIQ